MDKNDEQILVIKSDILFEKGKWLGLKTEDLDYYLDLIKTHCEFKRRGDMENDHSYQQIIPYIIYTYNNSYFVYTYLPGAGEQRLVGTYQFGIGGHINKEDVGENDILETGMMREWDEEVDFKGSIINKKFIGIINDETTSVEAVHIGLLYQFEGDSADIQIKESEKMAGEMVDIKDIKKCVESNPKSIWLQIVYRDYLSKMQ